MGIFEDPPIHDIRRNLLSRAFTPRKMNAIEPLIREFTTRFDKPVRFQPQPAMFRISGNSEVEILYR